MKRITQLISIFILGMCSKESFSQCVIDNNNFTDGFTPASLPCIDQGVFYQEVIQLHIPATTIYGGLTINVDSLLLLSVTGMPPGITYSSNPSGVPVPGGSNACILFSGTTNAAPGSYVLTFR